MGATTKAHHSCQRQQKRSCGEQLEQFSSTLPPTHHHVLIRYLTTICSWMGSLQNWQPL